MRLLFNDWCEYFAVCEECYFAYRDMQWAGSTYDPNWRERSAAYLKKHEETDGRCEFCDPEIGNGGWIVTY